MNGSEVLLLTYLQGLIALLGLLLVGRPLYRLLRLWIYRLTATRTWARVKAAPPMVVRSGTPVAWLRIPGTGISHLVIHEVTEANMLLHPVLHADFARLDGKRLRAITAHRDLHFRGLRKLSPGNEVLVELPNGRLDRYLVERIDIVDKEETNARLAPRLGEDLLVLITCYPFYYIGPAPQNFLAWCRPAPHA